MNYNFIESGLAWKYKKSGKITILWLHGYTMNNEIWDEVWHYLPDYSHLSVELPNHGKSTSINNFDSLEQISSTIHNTAQKYNVSYVFGLSFGGILGLQLAINFGNDFDGFILNSSPIAGSGLIDLDIQSRNLQLIRAFQNNASKEILSQIWIQSPTQIFDDLKNNPLRWQKLYEEIKKHSWSELNDSYFAQITEDDQMKHLTKLNTPIYYLLGENDMEFIKRTATVLKRKSTYITRIYLEDCGHLAILEHPEIITELICDCINKMSSSKT